MDDFFQNIFTQPLISSSSKGGVKRNPESSSIEKLNTVCKLYNYCLQHADESQLPSGEYVWDIFQHQRNKSRFSSKRNKKRLIHLNFSNCSTKSGAGYYSIWAFFPYPEVARPPADFVAELKFAHDNGDIFNYFCNKLTALHDKHSGLVPIVVAGEWERTKCEIISKRQIHIISKQ